MSKKLKLSPWHDGSVKPVHVGAYQVKTSRKSSIFYSWWDGVIFNGHFNEEHMADEFCRTFGHTNQGGCSKTALWRGVLK